MCPATIYVNGMRSIPLVMVILWFFLLMPAIIGRPIGAELSAVVTIAFEAAYFSEIMRAGIQSIPRGQVYAGQALGMTYSQNMKLVVLPQAFRNMLPVLLTQTIILFQDTSLVYAIGAYDMLKGFSGGQNLATDPSRRVPGRCRPVLCDVLRCLGCEAPAPEDRNYSVAPESPSAPSPRATTPVAWQSQPTASPHEAASVLAGGAPKSDKREEIGERNDRTQNVSSGMAQCRCSTSARPPSAKVKWWWCAALRARASQR